jgi:GTPase SAR1 family protein
MKLDETIQNTIPTIGFNVETISTDEFDLTLWDIGGSPKIIELWKHYYQNTDVVLFLVDASDPERFPIAKELLHKVIHEPELQSSHFHIILNKLTEEASEAKLKEYCSQLGLSEETSVKFQVHQVRTPLADHKGDVAKLMS